MTATILITAPEPNNSKLAALLREQGIASLQLPLLYYAAPADEYAALDAAIIDLPSYTHVVFASVQAVQNFHQRVLAVPNAQAALGHLKIAVVGESTARACATVGLPVHIMPSTYTGQALADVLSDRCRPTDQLLFPQAEEGRPEVAAALAATGLQLHTVVAYRTLLVPIDVALWHARLEQPNWQAAVATSPKGLKTFLDQFGHPWCHEQMATRQLIVMGPTTAATAENLGFRHVVAPTHNTLEALAQLITETVTSFLRAEHPVE